jgi:hypothetical protein
MVLLGQFPDLCAAVIVKLKIHGISNFHKLWVGLDNGGLEVCHI